MRHGAAEFGADSDFVRPLSKQGVSEVQKSAAALLTKLELTQSALTQSIRPNLILASPLLRAQQTAEIMLQKLNLKQGILTTEAVSPEGDPKAAASYLATCVEGYPDDQQISCMIITHQPFVSDFISWLTGSEIFVNTADVVCINQQILTYNGGEIKWQICI